jgi:hypothetical protein
VSNDRDGGGNIAVLILAGGKTKPEALPAWNGVENRAFAPLAPGRPMLDYVVEAVRGGLAQAAATDGGGAKRARACGDPAGCAPAAGRL